MTFREQVQLQASIVRRKMVRDGALLTQHEFLTLLGVDESQLESLVAAGSVFSIEVDDAHYFPAVLGDPMRDRTRVHSICRILVPAPSPSRLDFLESRQVALGGLSPLDALGDTQLYRSLRRLARAWAAAWSRTIVTVYIGSYLEEPEDVEPAHMAVDEIDPRTDLWTRALGALKAGGYISPPRMFPRPDEATVFLTRSEAGNLPTVLEARIALRVANHLAHAELFVPGAPRGEISVPLAAKDSVVDIVLRGIQAFRSLDERPD